MLVRTHEELGELVDIYSEFDEFVFDVETRGKKPNDASTNEVFWIALAGPGRADVIPMGHPDGGKQLWPADAFLGLRPLFFSDRRKIGHNVKFDLKSITKYYEEIPPPPYGDTIVAAWLINENRPRLRLGELVKYEFGFEYEKLGRSNKPMDSFPFDEVKRYNYLDAKYTWLLWRKYVPLLKEQKLTGVFKLEMDVLKALIRMELYGAPIDRDKMEELQVTLAKRLEDLERRVFSAAGYTFNLSSPPQRGKFVYEIRGHKPTKFTAKKGIPATDAEALKAFAGRDKIVADMLEWAEVKKLQGTYVEGLLPRLDRGAHLHADFVQYGTQTGRFSCREPNLQNIPRKQDAQIRGLFIAPHGCSLVVADYSQIELRVLAHFSGDKTLRRTFAENLDVHAETASRVLGIAPSDLSSDLRQLGKTLNFCVVYGGGPAKVAALSNISEKKAKTFLRQYEQQFPKVFEFNRQTVRECRRQKPAHVRTILGRKRRLPAINAQDWLVRGHAERQACNTRIQGSAADLIKLAMVRLDRLFEDTDMTMILTVHDEIVSVVPDGREDEAVELVKEAMEGITLLSVPLVADINVGKRWSEAKS